MRGCEASTSDLREVRWMRPRSCWRSRWLPRYAAQGAADKTTQQVFACIKEKPRGAGIEAHRSSEVRLVTREVTEADLPLLRHVLAPARWRRGTAEIGVLFGDRLELWDATGARRSIPLSALPPLQDPPGTPPIRPFFFRVDGAVAFVGRCPFGQTSSYVAVELASGRSAVVPARSGSPHPSASARRGRLPDPSGLGSARNDAPTAREGDAPERPVGSDHDR